MTVMCSSGIAGVPPARSQRAGRPRSRGSASQGGFTLVELLVATGIFVLGFSVCLGLFLAGMRHRTAAEDHLRLGFAASSLVEELGLVEMATPGAPSSFVTTPSDPFRQVRGHQHVWYRIEKCQNAVVTNAADPDGAGGTNDLKVDTLLTTLLVVSFATPGTNLTYEDINRRLRVITSSTGTLDAAQQQQLTDHLLARQLALRMETVILRRAP